MRGKQNSGLGPQANGRYGNINSDLLLYLTTVNIGHNQSTDGDDDFPRIELFLPALV
jgi:hypothetical protein